MMGPDPLFPDSQPPPPPRAMPLVTTQNAASQRGVKTSFADTIFVADSQETPWYSGVKKKGPPGEIIYAYPVDLPGYVSNRGKRQSTPPKGVSDQAKNYNVIQTTLHHITETVGMSLLMDLVRNRAGIGQFGKELALQVAKVLLALKQAVERTGLDEGDCMLETDAVGTAYETRGLFKWCSSSAQTVLPVPTKFLTPAGQIYSETVDGAKTFSALRESHLLELIRGVWEKTGKKHTLKGFIGSLLQTKISSWQKTEVDDGEIIVRRFNGTEGVLTQQVNMMKSDFGSIMLNPSRYLLRTRGKSDAEHTDAELQRAARSGIFTADDSTAMSVALAPEMKPLGEGSSAGKSREVQTVFGIEAQPQMLAKVDVT